MQTPGSRDVLRFGDFELDLAAYELRRRGRPVKLGRQPMDLLILLVERRGHLVSRSDIVERLWGKDVFVDVETGVNTAVSKVRQALRDSAGAPALLETVAGKGYRFIATVELVSAGPPPAVGATPSSADSPAAPVDGGAASRPRRAIRPRIWIGALLALMTAGIVSFSGITDIVRTRAVTLAVLPFENLGSDPEREYLAAGLTDDTSASLAQIDPAHLIVKGRTLRYKGTTKTAGEIGQELGVDYLVESSIRAEGALVRVTVTLIRARDQQHLWSQSYDREPTSLLSLQQELSAAIAAQVKLRLSPDRLNDLGRRQTLNADAYDLYLRGRDQAHRRTADGNARAIELYKRAIAIDGNYALAWADLAFTYGAATINGDAPPGAVGPHAREAAMQSVRANPELPEAQLSLGYELWLIEWDWNAAEAALRRAVELDPSSATAHRILGHALSQFGRRDESEASMQRARELDPVDAINHALSSQVAFQNRDLAAAVDARASRNRTRPWPVDRIHRARAGLRGFG